MRNTNHGSGLGRWRWVVERTFAWLNQFRRLRLRYEKRARHAPGISDSRVHSDLLEVPTSSTAVVAG
jgi:transposase